MSTSNREHSSSDSHTLHLSSTMGSCSYSVSLSTRSHTWTSTAVHRCASSILRIGGAHGACLHTHTSSTHQLTTAILCLQFPQRVAIVIPHLHLSGVTHAHQRWCVRALQAFRALVACRGHICIQGFVDPVDECMVLVINNIPKPVQGCAILRVRLQQVNDTGRQAVLCDYHMQVHCGHIAAACEAT